MSAKAPLIGFAGLSSLASQVADKPELKKEIDSSDTDHPKHFHQEVETETDKPQPSTSSASKNETGATRKEPSAGFEHSISTTIGVIALLAFGLYLISLVAEHRPKTSQPSTAYSPAPDSAAKRNPPSQPALPVVPPPTYTETAPTPGDGLRVFNQGNIRWCLYQDRRIEIIRSTISGLRSNEDVSSFNAIIGDYNTRCGSYRYSKNDMAMVRAELGSKEPNFQAQATQIVRDWPHRKLASLPTRPPSPVQPAAPIDTARPSSAGNIEPQVRPGLVLTDTPAPSVPSLDLLQIEDATTVQRRLAELGFYVGQPNGIWGARSRQALREFKSVNSLPGDDAWDRATNTQLLSPSAQAKVIVQPGTTPADPMRGANTNYPPPPGAKLNPLNPVDAISLQKRLVELGFSVGITDGVWGPASRIALKGFKVASGLAPDDQWNAETERALENAGSKGPLVPANETFIGGWAGTISECPIGQIGEAPLQITDRRAEIGETVCNFEPPLPEGSGWRTKAVCIAPGKKAWKSNVKIMVSGGQLTWSSDQGGEVSFYRCPGG